MKWTLEKQKNNKKEKIVWFELFIPLFFSPVCRFYFPGSPLCFSSRCLHLSVPSLLLWWCVCLFCPREKPGLTMSPCSSSSSSSSSLTRPPVCRFSFLFLTRKNWTKTRLNTTTGTFSVQTNKQTDSSLSAFTCEFMDGNETRGNFLWCCLFQLFILVLSFNLVSSFSSLKLQDEFQKSLQQQVVKGL